MTFQGSIVAIVTPMRNGAVDLPRLRELAEWHVRSGTNGIVVCGTTGEAATLSTDERRDAVVAVLETVNERIPVIAGTGSNDTARTVSETQAAERLGVSGALVVTPYYNKPTQRGLVEHFRAVARGTSLPIVLYNVPGRTGVNMTADTVAALCEERNVVAIKEAGGSLDAVSAIRAKCSIAVLSGDDGLTLPMMAVGAVGVISVVANVMPAETAGLCHSVRQGDWARARDLHYKLFPVIQAMFVESNPIPVKTALKHMGKLTGEMRLPLCAMSEDNEGKLLAALKGAGLVGLQP